MNKQITEDYVSFEIAKLLKEKGFDVPVYQYYFPPSNDNLNYSEFDNDWNSVWEHSYSAPTLQMALKWLREVHNWYIDIRFNRHYQYYIPIVYNMSGTLESIANLEERPKQYEEAVDAALDYVLKNLI